MAQIVSADYDIVINKTTDNVTNTAHISSNLPAYEAERSGFFIFMPANAEDPVLELIAEKMKTYDKSCTFTASQVQEILKLNVTKAAEPTFELDKLSFRRGNEVVNFAGVPTFNDGSFTTDSIVGVDTYSLLQAWKELAYNPATRTGGRMYEYKMDCNLIVYTQDYRPVRTWLMEGCWIRNNDGGDFDKENDGKRQIQCTVIYDRATMVRGLNGDSKETEKK